MTGSLQTSEPLSAAAVEAEAQQSSPSAPYRSTPVFDEVSLPAGLRADHQLKAGTWGLIQVLEGELRLTYREPYLVVTLTPGTPGRIAPQQLHFVEPLGAMKMRVDFYDHPPG